MTIIVDDWQSSDQKIPIHYSKRLCVLTLLIFLGCAEGRFNSSAERSTNDPEIVALIEVFTKSMKARDWETLRDLHWSESELTAENLKDLFAQPIEKIKPVGSFATTQYLSFSASNYEKYMDDEELPGPADLIAGTVEFNVISAESNSYILVWVYLCREDGKLKIYDYIEIDWS